jgi:hypothetical protein
VGSLFLGNSILFFLLFPFILNSISMRTQTLIDILRCLRLLLQVCLGIKRQSIGVEI